MRILIVEDETGLTDVLRAVLEDDNYDVDVAGDGEEGYYQGLTGIYDVMILDWMLPGMEGYEILRLWRKEGIETPVLMLTARSELQDKLQGLMVGADDYMTKPFEMAELVARVKVMIRKSSKGLKKSYI